MEGGASDPGSNHNRSIGDREYGYLTASNATHQSNQARAVDLSEVEDASADLFTANVMITAVERFVTDVRSWLEYKNSGDQVKASLTDLDTMLMEVRDRVELAKNKIDFHVSETYAEKRLGKAS